MVKRFCTRTNAAVEARALTLISMVSNGQGWVCSGFPANADEVDMLLAAEAKPNKIINLKLDDSIVQQVASRLRSRRRDKETKKVLYLEDQSPAFPENDWLECLSEDRGTLATEAAEAYKAGYEKLQKSLAKLGHVESVAAAEPEDMRCALQEFVTLMP